MGLLDKVRAIAAAAAKQYGGLLLPEVPLWQQFSRIGGSIMPQDVSSIIREADIGKPARLVDLIHECRQKDGHLQATLGVRELAVAGLKWCVEPPPNATAAEKRQAELCTLAIRESAGFHVLLAHLTGEGCLFPTGAWAEVVWTVEPFGDLAGLEVPAFTKPISSRRFGFRRTDGELVFVESGKDPDTDGVDLLDQYGFGKFICRRPRVNGDVPAREGLARVLVWQAVLRNWGVRDWLAAGEMSWKPWRLATYKKGSDTEDRAFAEAAIETITSTAAAVMPETVDLKVEWPKSTGSSLQSVHRELCEFFGQEISKSVLGQTLTTEAGLRGARALGQVHDNIRLDIRNDDAIDVAASLNAYLVEPFYAFNFGDSARRGRFVFNTTDGIDYATLSDAIMKIGDMVAIPQAWVREQMGIPEPRKDEEICGTRAPADSGSSPSDAEDDGNDGDDDSEE